jgi:hypothetical protein
LLKGITAVADVPNTEDFGLDAIATLLRRDSEGNSYAEDSFVVQLKSSSVTSVDYRDHELSWFLAQSVPNPAPQGAVWQPKPPAHRHQQRSSPTGP